jgi:hypothetical protein
MNVVALPVDNGYVTLGHLVEHHPHGWDASRAVQQRGRGRRSAC